MPHLYCLRGEPAVLWLHVVSDLAIAIAYFAIPLVLLQVVLARTDMLFRKVALLFVLFIAACGTTHLLAIWTIWYPMYRLEGVVKAATAIISVATALSLVWLRPMILKIPSIAELEAEIAERRKAREEAHDKDEWFRSYVEGVSDYAIYLVDLAGLIQTWNVGAQRIKGYRAEEIIGRHFSCFYTPEDLAAGKPGHGQETAIATGEYAEEGWRLRKDGSRFWAKVTLRPSFDASGTFRGFTKITRDMTESRALEAKYKSLLQGTPEAIVIVNRMGGIEFINAQAESLFGYPKAEVIGNPVDMLVPLTAQEQKAQYLNHFFEGVVHLAPDLQPYLPPEVLARRKDGTEFPVEISLSPLEGPDGISVAASIRDITERRQTAQQLAEKMVELRQSNEALEEFANIASHDLQEPLRMVTSYTQLLAKRYKGRLDSDADDFIGFVVDGTQRMKQLINDLLLYSRAGKGSPPIGPLQSEAVLRAALGNLRASIAESEACVTYDRLPPIVGDELQLVQVFQNLIGNAIKYRGDRVPRIHVSAKCEGQEWVFSVADNGIGIEPRSFDRIFVIFQRLHGRGEYEGTGIGLAICKRILQQQGGRIWVESEPDKGSTFYFSVLMR